MILHNFGVPFYDFSYSGPLYINDHPEMVPHDVNPIYISQASYIIS